MFQKPVFPFVFSITLACLAAGWGGFPINCRADRPVAGPGPVLNPPGGSLHASSPGRQVSHRLPMEIDVDMNVDGSLLDEVERAREELDVDQLPDLEAAEADVVQKIADLKSYLQRRADQENRAAWLKYLQLNPLREAIEEEQSIGSRGRASLALESRLRGVEVGLDLPPMLALRESVQDYVAALRYSDPKRGIAFVERQLDGLVELLSVDASKNPQSHKRNPNTKSGGDEDESRQGRPQARPLHELSAEDVAQMQLLIGGLTDANQAERLVTMIRRQYSQPNLRVWVDGRAITDAVMRPVNTPSDVNDCILGTRVIGNSRVDGRVRGRLLPAEGHIRLLIQMHGLFTTSSRGFRKPITLDTTGLGNVYAARQLAISEKGITLGETIATADLTTQVHRINHPWRLVRRIAAKKAEEQRPRAEAISREKLREEILYQFDEKTAEAAERRFPSLDAKINPWFRRLDLPPLIRRIGSTTESVYAVANLQRPTGLAARQSPPPLTTVRTSGGSGIFPGGYFAAVQVHQSVLDNTLSPLLAGETFSPGKIEQLAEGLGLELPARSAGKGSEHATDTEQENDSEQRDEQPAEQENFEVDLANFRPVFVEADNQQLRVGMRGTRFSQDGRELKRTLEVSATYRPVSTGDGRMSLLRDEEVKLSFPGTRRLSIGQTAIKTNMERSFNELFPKELLHRSLPLPPAIEAPALAGKVLQIQAIDLTDGWITIVAQ